MIDLLRVSPHVTPSDRMRAGLMEVHHGIAGSRAEIDRLIRAQAAERAALVDTRYRLTAERRQVDRALAGRPLYTSEQEQARERDGVALDRNARGETAIDPATVRSLDVYCLRRGVDVPAPRLDEETAWRRILGGG